MTGMEPLIDPIAGSLVGLVIDLAQKVGGKVAQSMSDRHQVSQALKQYEAKYRTRHGTLKLLGMRESIDLETIYTKVRFLDELSIKQFVSLEALEQTYREAQQRRFQRQEAGNLEPADVVNQHQYLMVLGAPGTGKSTFLRRAGLEAFKGEQGKFQHDCIPVMLELKRFNSDHTDLTAAIAEELQNFGFPAAEFATKALENGKLLILLDGLDEVPKANLDAVVEKIQAFVTKYDQNRYIASCRIAAYRSSFQRFTDIELAEFDDEQIQQFINNWFQSESDHHAETAAQCWQTLNEPGNAAAKELAQTPLLLTFLCTVYDRTQGFRSSRATLYGKALDILLEEWAAEKRVHRDPVYQGLNPDLEKVLLSEIAHTGFVQDQLFFIQQELVEQIKIFLSDTVDKPKYLDGRAVLDAIAIQQGILVKRAEDVYSFSHLTLQEYLTAKYISQDLELVQVLVARHLTEQRWREVFILIAGSIRSADKLLELVQKTAQAYLSFPKLQALIQWADRATQDSEGDYKPAAKRVTAIFLALDLDRALDLALDHALALDLDNARSRTLTRARTLARALDHALDHARDRALDQALAFALDRGRGRARTLAREFERIKIFKSVNFPRLISALIRLQAPGNDQPLDIRRAFVEQIYHIWFEALQLQPTSVELSEEESNALADYLYACELMVQCKEAAVRVSAKVWQGIEERMLTVQD